MSTLSRTQTARAVVNTVRDKEVTFLAASISYYILVSLVPLLVLALVAAALVGGETFSARVMAFVRANLPAGEGLVSQALGNQTSQGGLGLLSLLLTVWGALKVFRGLDTAFGRIYAVAARGIVDQLKDGAAALASIGVGVAGVLVLGSLIAVIDSVVVGLLGPFLLLGTLVVAFLPLYYILPDADVTVREVLPGTVFAAVGWSVLGTGFGIYAQEVGGSVAGALGALLLLMTWFYLSGILILTGAVINAVTGGRTGGGDENRDRQVQHPGDRRDRSTEMSEGETERHETIEPRGAPDISELEDRVEELRADLDDFERDVDDRTLPKADVEAELKRYVRRRMRRGKARGWGPYLVLLYGTVMTLGAFFFLDGVWAIVAMLVLFLSTLGLYTLFLIVGIGFNVLSVPGKAADAVRDRRS
ncbi:YihY/virulence factor BrkB family protein [Salinigranum marinum]|uniref:YihY/virulence factor BrkB family protein n=1 Tax=Salinigranum marinum TaxID=1515595 RepID=UPI002989B5C0|nr:YihY/virulence factor BrkB family protein [Salinigranum marinum]